MGATHDSSQGQHQQCVYGSRVSLCLLSQYSESSSLSVSHSESESLITTGPEKHEQEVSIRSQQLHDEFSAQFKTHTAGVG